ncbi:Mur ligase family protein [Alloscardovia criceti]|uniref:Mur ligase family protein n=1 Tax=Alloscardovia criceti TaxID=356828 RepID=UPI00036A51AE|nr:Mur ligase family protein [Alloscardovia criceti]
MARTFLSALTPAVGKAVRAVARLRSGGTALPGKVVELIDPDFMARTLAQLPYGVILVSGTNGKTTTTRIVASLLEQVGLKVFTNPTGSNFTRGVVSALLGQVDMKGRLHADVAVLELDEAYAVHFVEKVRPRFSLLLNILRDQLDRFGEIDTTARMLSAVAQATTDTVILNREDPRIVALAEVVADGTDVQYFGLSDALMSFFPSDDAMYEHSEDATPDDNAAEQKFDLAHYRPAAVTLQALQGNTATYAFGADEGTYNANLKLEGVYNAFNTAGALAVVDAVMRHTEGATQRPSHAELVLAASTVTPAFGRGESIRVGDRTVELILVKNPMGFRLALTSFEADNHDTMIIINDEYADGRDMSWLWDVNFRSLAATGVRMVSGVRATDMALRLAYDSVEVEEIHENISEAVEKFVSLDNGHDKHIYCTYTAMLAARKALSRIAHVEDVGL